jgi:hypothetical protein
MHSLQASRKNEPSLLDRQTSLLAGPPALLSIRLIHSSEVKKISGSIPNMSHAFLSTVALEHWRARNRVVANLGSHVRHMAVMLQAKNGKTISFSRMSCFISKEYH